MGYWAIFACDDFDTCDVSLLAPTLMRGALGWALCALTVKILLHSVQIYIFTHFIKQVR